jgi:hypothetical protein
VDLVWQQIPVARRPTRSVAQAPSGGRPGSAPQMAMTCGTAAIAAGEKKREEDSLSLRDRRAPSQLERDE